MRPPRSPLRAQSLRLANPTSSYFSSSSRNPNPSSCTHTNIALTSSHRRVASVDLCALPPLFSTDFVRPRSRCTPDAVGESEARRGRRRASGEGRRGGRLAEVECGRRCARGRAEPELKVVSRSGSCRPRAPCAWSVVSGWSKARVNKAARPPPSLRTSSRLAVARAGRAAGNRSTHQARCRYESASNGGELGVGLGRAARRQEVSCWFSGRVARGPGATGRIFLSSGSEHGVGTHRSQSCVLEDGSAPR